MCIRDRYMGKHQSMDDSPKEQHIDIKFGGIKEEPSDFTYSTVRISLHDDIAFGSKPQNTGPIKIIEIKEDPAIKPLHCIISYHENNGLFIVPAYNGCECYVEALVNKWNKLPSSKLIIGSTKIKFHRITPCEIKVTMKDSFNTNSKSSFIWETSNNIMIGRMQPTSWRKYVYLAGEKPLEMVLAPTKDKLMSRQHIILTFKEGSLFVYPISENPTYMCCSDCLLYTSPSPRDQRGSRMPSSA
eukprot:TRINITY_DN630_c0_g1_i7.p1 TRINITY_DN630_c0_g1~~TRINITY_DN630_c0_g1_i7.p1  ORF type:complete len:243 (-),score=58.49 TRINITY_DN630_c0_g1_i7:12-740(-)